MLKDIDFKKVEDTAMAIIPEEDGDELVWNAYLINTGDSVIRSVLVNSKGYGEIEEKTEEIKLIKTSLEKMLNFQSFLIKLKCYALIKLLKHTTSTI